jgi:hypothetical protein
MMQPAQEAGLFVGFLFTISAVASYIVFRIYMERQNTWRYDELPSVYEHSFDDCQSIEMQSASYPGKGAACQLDSI